MIIPQLAGSPPMHMVFSLRVTFLTSLPFQRLEISCGGSPSYQVLNWGIFSAYLVLLNFHLLIDSGVSGPPMLNWVWGVPTDIDSTIRYIPVFSVLHRSLWQCLLLWNCLSQRNLSPGKIDLSKCFSICRTTWEKILRNKLLKLQHIGVVGVNFTRWKELEFCRNCISFWNVYWVSLS